MYRYILTYTGICWHYVQLYTNIIYGYMLKCAVNDEDTNLKDRHAQLLNSPNDCRLSAVQFKQLVPTSWTGMPLHSAVSITSLQYLFPFIKFQLYIPMKINNKNHVIHYTRSPQFASHDNMQTNPERHSMSTESVPIGEIPLGSNPTRSDTCTHLQFCHKAGR